MKSSAIYQQFFEAHRPTNGDGWEAGKSQLPNNFTRILFKLIANQMVCSWNLEIILLAFCLKSTYFPRLKALEIIWFWTNRAWNYSLISLVTIWIPILIEISTLRACRSFSREWPRRMASAGRRLIKCFWTSANVVVTSLSISGVMPLYLYKKNETPLVKIFNQREKGEQLLD